MPELSYEQILKTLPHRYPFLLVDKIVECDDETRIVGIKNVTFNEPYFQGHFPDDPIMPGVLQLECMAQVGGILLNRKNQREGSIAYFMAIDGAKFRRMVRPGDQLRIEIVFLKARRTLAKVQGAVYVGDDVASEAELTFGFVG